MVKFSLLLLVSFLTVTARCQFAIITDKDGFVNVRSSPGTGDNIVDTLSSGGIVWCFEPAGNWSYVDYRRKDDIVSGYIYRDRLTFIDQYSEIPRVKISTDSLVMKNDDVQIRLTAGPFIPGRHVLTYNVTDGQHYLEKIDGAQPWGTDGDIPKRQYDSISVFVNGQNAIIKGTDYAGLYEPNFQTAHAHYDHNSGTLYIDAMNGDGAGGYCLLWVIKNGVCRQRVIFYGF